MILPCYNFNFYVIYCISFKQFFIISIYYVIIIMHQRWKCSHVVEMRLNKWQVNVKNVCYAKWTSEISQGEPILIKLT